MMAALVEAIRFTKESCQPYRVFTCDQQLYKIDLDIKWTYHEKFQNVIPRLGGMHFLMSFVRSIRCLMLNTGLDLIPKSAFGSVEKMLNEKNFPQNVRALRMVVEELLLPYLKDIHCINDLTNFLDNISQWSPVG